MKLSQLKSKKILILGLGLEGQATFNFLRRHFPNRQIATADVKNNPHYLEKQKNYDLVIKSPGIPKRLVTTRYTTATNIFFANTAKKIIGITGSKGKSTTASLLRDILIKADIPVKLVGNIGNPMLTALLEPEPKELIYICELSSYQLDDIEYSPHISVILNLFPEHMDYHQGVKNYWQAKKNIIMHATPADYFIYNPAYQELAKLAKQSAAKAVPFIQKLPFSETIIPLLGQHNKDNVRAAVTVAQLLNRDTASATAAHSASKTISQKAIKTAVQNFTPLPHRLQNIGTFRDITFYDDAISTTPESTIEAIKALSGQAPIGAIFLGGTDRGYDFSYLAQTIISHKILNIILFPDSGAKILQAINKAINDAIPQPPLKIKQTMSMEEAIKFAYANTPKNSICLLSTASPSYSLWQNFEEKGKLFHNFVTALNSLEQP